MSTDTSRLQVEGVKRPPLSEDKSCYMSSWRFPEPLPGSGKDAQNSWKSTGNCKCFAIGEGQ